MSYPNEPFVFIFASQDGLLGLFLIPLNNNDPQIIYNSFKKHFTSYKKILNWGFERDHPSFKDLWKWFYNVNNVSSIKTILVSEKVNLFLENVYIYHFKDDDFTIINKNYSSWRI